MVCTAQPSWWKFYIFLQNQESYLKIRKEFKIQEFPMFLN